LDYLFISKIPPDLPFPKGGISGIFMLLCGPKVYTRFISVASFVDKEAWPTFWISRSSWGMTTEKVNIVVIIMGQLA